MAEEEDFDAPLIAELYKPPALLPIAERKDSLLYAIETYPVTIIVSCPKRMASGYVAKQGLPTCRWARPAAEKRLKSLNFCSGVAGLTTVLRSP